MPAKPRASASSDRPRGPAVAALRRAVDWAIQEGCGLPGVLERTQLAGLLDVLDGRRAWGPEWTRPLGLFAQIAWRLHPRLPGPRLGLAEALAAVPALARQDAPGWSFDGDVDDSVFAALGYARGVPAIDEQQRTNERGWRAHGEKARRFIEQAAERLPPGGTAAILGAARDYDLPLEALARRFDRLILVDIDGDALAATRDACTNDPALRARFELRRMDLTGLTTRVGAEVDRAIQESPSRERAVSRCAQLYARWAAAAPTPVFWAPDTGVQFAVSCLVLSQLAPRLEAVATRALEARFGAATQAEPRLEEAHLLFAWRVQQAHVNALCTNAPHAVLISDVSEQVTTLGEDGVVRGLSEPLDLLGAARLEERLPANVLVEARGEWTWRRVLPVVPGGLGSDMRVHALSLSGQRAAAAATANAKADSR